MALSAAGRVVGVALNGSHEPGHLEEMQKNADSCPNPRFRNILQLLAAVERGSDVFSKFPDVDRLVELRILSVDTALRGRGIAKALLEESRSVKGKAHLMSFLSVATVPLFPPLLVFISILCAFHLSVFAFTSSILFSLSLGISFCPWGRLCTVTTPRPVLPGAYIPATLSLNKQTNSVALSPQANYTD
jgi:hypothetical protein